MTEMVLGPDEARALLREFAVVVRPGETLILRVSDLTPNQVYELQEAVNGMQEYYGLPFQTIVLPGDELGVAANEITHAFPGENDGGVMPCCGRTPLQVPRTDRLTQERMHVTCRGQEGAVPCFPIQPVPIDEPPGGWRPEPRRWKYHVGGTCGRPQADGTCGCGTDAQPDAG